jgi:sensor histidine kinase regulating citrate/malate metabolism
MFLSENKKHVFVYGVIQKHVFLEKSKISFFEIEIVFRISKSLRIERLMRKLKPKKIEAWINNLMDNQLDIFLQRKTSREIELEVRIEEQREHYESIRFLFFFNLRFSRGKIKDLQK